jgi:transposase
MFFPESHIKIWLYAKATDMRKSFDGLAALAKNKLGECPVDGALFVFINKRQTQIKILYFDRSGYCLWAKRLEEGRFNYNKNNGEKQSLNWTQLKLIIEGIDVLNTRQKKRYNHPVSATDLV